MARVTRVALLALGLTAVAAPALLPSACGGKPEGSPEGAGATSASTGAGGHGGGTPTTQSTASTTGTGSASTSSTSSTTNLGGDGWLPFPAEGCDAQYILNPPDWPKRAWTSCGPGCLVANANSIDAPWPPARYASGAKVVDGELYVLTSLGFDEQKIYELTRMSDGKVLAAVRHAFPDCGTSGGKSRSPFIINLFTDYDLLKQTLSVYEPNSASFSILGDVFTNTIQSWFTWDDGWGLLDANQVRLGLTPGSAETTTVFKDGGAQTYARARKNMVIWVDESTFPPRIRRWTKELGVGVLYQPPDYAVRPALSDDAIVWVGGHPDPEAPYIHVATELYWASWSDTSLVPIKGPDITGMLLSGNDMIAGGDYVAVFGGGPKNFPFGVIVVQRSTQKKWYLYAPDDHMLVPSALSATELVVQELGPSPKLEFLNYRRYDLSRLDESSGPWPGPP